MKKARRIYFTVTNDLSYDQRMQRICGSLAANGFDVHLVGRLLPHSIALKEERFRQHRLRCFWNKGFLFYAEYNLRLFFFLLFRKMDALCAIDLDTILAAWFLCRIKKTIPVYDAHEYFTELKEVRTRPAVQKVWLAIERFCLPRFRNGYTVSRGLADAFARNYGVQYEVVRNVPVLVEDMDWPAREQFLLYQGAVNEGRGFEYLIPALARLPYELVVCGDGNFMPKLKTLVHEYKVEHRVKLTGMLPPSGLRPIAKRAALGMGLAEKEGINQFMALPNKFLDYMHAGLPQLAMAYPEYEKINELHPVAVLLPELNVDAVADAIQRIMEDPAARKKMSDNCLTARRSYCWQEEEKILLNFYTKLFHTD